LTGFGVLEPGFEALLGRPSFSKADSPTTELKQFIMNSARVPKGSKWSKSHHAEKLASCSLLDCSANQGTKVPMAISE
jgi:hypothetical protein